MTVNMIKTDSSRTICASQNFVPPKIRWIDKKTMGGRDTEKEYIMETKEACKEAIEYITHAAGIKPLSESMRVKTTVERYDLAWSRIDASGTENENAGMTVTVIDFWWKRVDAEGGKSLEGSLTIMQKWNCSGWAKFGTGAAMGITEMMGGNANEKVIKLDLRPFRDGIRPSIKPVKAPAETLKINRTVEESNTEKRSFLGREDVVPDVLKLLVAMQQADTTSTSSFLTE